MLSEAEIQQLFANLQALVALSHDTDKAYGLAQEVIKTLTKMAVTLEVYRVPNFN